jgi:hypothetical protein
VSMLDGTIQRTKRPCRLFGTLVRIKWTICVHVGRDNPKDKTSVQVIWDLGEDKVDNLCPCWMGQSKGQNVHAGYSGPW